MPRHADGAEEVHRIRRELGVGTLAYLSTPVKDASCIYYYLRSGIATVSDDPRTTPLMLFRQEKNGKGLSRCPRDHKI